MALIQSSIKMSEATTYALKNVILSDDEDLIYNYFRKVNFNGFEEIELSDFIVNEELPPKATWWAKIFLVDYYLNQTEINDQFGMRLIKLFESRLDNEKVIALEKQYGRAP